MVEVVVQCCYTSYFLVIVNSDLPVAEFLVNTAIAIATATATSFDDSGAALTLGLQSSLACLQSEGRNSTFVPQTRAAVILCLFCLLFLVPSFLRFYYQECNRILIV